MNIFFSNNHSLASLTNKERSVHASHSEKMIVFSTSTKSFSHLNLAMLTKCTYEHFDIVFKVSTHVKTVISHYLL